MTEREREGLSICMMALVCFILGAIGGYYGDMAWFYAWLAISGPLFIAGFIRLITSGDDKWIP